MPFLTGSLQGNESISHLGKFGKSLKNVPNGRGYVIVPRRVEHQADMLGFLFSFLGQCDQSYAFYQLLVPIPGPLSDGNQWVCSTVSQVAICLGLPDI